MRLLAIIDGFGTQGWYRIEKGYGADEVDIRLVDLGMHDLCFLLLRSRSVLVQAKARTTRLRFFGSTRKVKSLSDIAYGV